MKFELKGGSKRTIEELIVEISDGKLRSQVPVEIYRDGKGKFVCLKVGTTEMRGLEFDIIDFLKEKGKI